MLSESESLNPMGQDTNHLRLASSRRWYSEIGKNYGPTDVQISAVQGPCVRKSEILPIAPTTPAYSANTKC